MIRHRPSYPKLAVIYLAKPRKYRRLHEIGVLLVGVQLTLIHAGGGMVIECYARTLVNVKKELFVNMELPSDGGSTSTVREGN